jgi:hypothetical protein
MQLDEPLTLEKAIEMSRQHEAVKRQQKDLRGEVQSGSLDRVEEKEVPTKSPAVTVSSRPLLKECLFCGKSHEKKKVSCPAWRKKCFKGRELNHFAVKCKAQSSSTSNAAVNHVEIPPSSPKKRFVGALTVVGHVQTG